MVEGTYPQTSATRPEPKKPLPYCKRGSGIILEELWPAVTGNEIEKNKKEE